MRFRNDNGPEASDPLQAIPEIGDHTTKKKKRETFTPVPDMLLTDAAAAGQMGNSIVGGAETPGGSSTSLTEIGQGRQMVVDISLKRAGESYFPLPGEWDRRSSHGKSK